MLRLVIRLTTEGLKHGACQAYRGRLGRPRGNLLLSDAALATLVEVTSSCAGSRGFLGSITASRRGAGDPLWSSAGISKHVASWQERERETAIATDSDRQRHFHRAERQGRASLVMQWRFGNGLFRRVLSLFDVVVQTFSSDVLCKFA